MRESNIERIFCRDVKSRGGKAYKLESRHRVGWPDRLVILPGQVFFVEFKAPGKLPTRLQEHVHGELTALGCEVYVVDGVDKGRNLLHILCGTTQEQ